MAPAEAKLWKHLRAHRMGDIHFRNQHAIGKYIVDFSQRDAVQCSPRKKLIIELDGSQHLEQKEYDDERTKYLELRGYRVLRFWNNDVMNNIDDVLKAIWNVLKDEKGMKRDSHSGETKRPPNSAENEICPAFHSISSALLPFHGFRFRSTSPPSSCRNSSACTYYIGSMVAAAPIAGLHSPSTESGTPVRLRLIERLNDMIVAVITIPLRVSFHSAETGSDVVIAQIEKFQVSIEPSDSVSFFNWTSGHEKVFLGPVKSP